jgi:hypothetical protein
MRSPAIQYSSIFLFGQGVDLALGAVVDTVTFQVRLPQSAYQLGQAQAQGRTKFFERLSFNCGEQDGKSGRIWFPLAWVEIRKLLQLDRDSIFCAQGQ